MTAENPAGKSSPSTESCNDESDDLRYRDPLWLQDKYHKEAMSLSEIADECGTCPSVVLAWMERYSIDRRSQGGGKIPDGAEDTYRDREWLIENYVEKGKLAREMASSCDVSKSTILRWLHQHDIPVRDRTRIAPWANYRMNSRNYMSWRGYSHREGEKRVQVEVRVHTLLMIAEGADPHKLFGGPKSSHVVHHKNEIRWDNRPENLEVMARSEHGREHWPGEI